VKRFVSLQFLRQSVELLGRDISPSQGRCPHRTTQTDNKCRQTSMLWVRFEPTIPVFESAKAVHALHRAATVIGSRKCTCCQRSLYHSLRIPSVAQAIQGNKLLLMLEINAERCTRSLCIHNCVLVLQKLTAHAQTSCNTRRKYRRLFLCMIDSWGF
jgi:hypothetical protein